MGCSTIVISTIQKKSDKTDYVRRLEGLVFEKKSDIIERDRERERQRERERERDRENLP